ncbi:MAG: phosphoglucomutase/phosphomannomutase family protein, partial [Elusimicrobiota bacterium]
MKKEDSTAIKFGTDGWRGVMAKEFTFDNVRRVAQAIAEHLKAQPSGKKKPTIVIGYDRRFQSEAYAGEIAGIFDANDMQAVISTETLPTPAISYLSKKMKALGIMVTASHNPPAYNGIKIKIDGRAASEQVTTSVESLIDRSNPMRSGSGRIQLKSFRKDYLQYLRSQINPSAFAGRLKKKFIVDYLYGS